jgi:hypothetical protein
MTKLEHPLLGRVRQLTLEYANAQEAHARVLRAAVTQYMTDTQSSTPGFTNLVAALKAGAAALELDAHQARASMAPGATA